MKSFARIRHGLSVVLLLLLAGQASAQKLAKELKQQDANGDVDVIIEYSSPVTSSHHAFIQSLGGRLNHSYKHLRNHASYTVPGWALSLLEADGRVKHVSKDHTVQPLLDITTATVGAQAAWNVGLFGDGVDIAVIDSGINVDADLTDYWGHSRVDYAQSFVPGDSSTADAYGHGTHVAGILASNGYNSSSYRAFRTFMGVAPNAHLINLRVLDASGSGKDSQVVAAIDRAIALKSQYNIGVINLSLGRNVFESYTQDPLCKAVERAWQAGIVVVVAAGNNGRLNDQGQNGYGTIMAPANDPYVITVGAMKANGTPNKADDAIATYSSKGPTAIDHIAKPDIVAPGNLVDSVRAPGSTLDLQFPQNRVAYNYYLNTWNTGYSPYYFTLSGTSMASPVVAGAAALLLESDPTLTPDLIKARLMKTASKSFPTSTTYVDPTGATYTSYYDVFTVGAGYLDIAAALANTDRPTGAALSPTAVLDPVSGNVMLTTPLGQTVVWGGSIAWGSSVVWGGSIAWGSSTTNAYSNTSAESILLSGEN